MQGSRTGRGRRAALVALLLARLALGFAYSAANPLGEAPDEADHYAYAAAIARDAALPRGTEMTQAKHPPLYHALAGVAGLPGGLDFSFLRSNPDVSVKANEAAHPTAAPNFFVHTTLERWPWRGGALSMHLGRLVSVLAGVVLVAATYGIGRRLWPARPAVALMAAAFAAFLPESLFVGGSVSNDMLAAALSALALLAALGAHPHAQASRHAGSGRPEQSGAAATEAPRPPRLAPAILTGVLMALAFLTKVSTVALWPVAVLLLCLPPRRSGFAALRTRLPLAVAASLVALAGVAPWLWRNWQLYGDPMGTPLVLATIDQRAGSLTVADLGWLLKGWFFSFWGKFGGAGHIPLPAAFYVVWAVILAAALGGWLWGLRRRDATAGAAGLHGWLVLAAAPLLTAVTMIGYSRIALGTDQGRLLFPALGPLALLIAGGIAAWLPGRRPALAAGWAAGLAAVAVLALAWGIVLPFAAPPAPSAATLAAARPLDAEWPGSLALQAVDWRTEGPVTLYWRADAPIASDLRVELRVLGAGGSVLWQWRRSPAAGRFSTDRWPAGRVVGDTYAVPAEALAAAQRVEVGVYDFASGDLLAPLGAAAAGYYAFEASLP